MLDVVQEIERLRAAIQFALEKCVSETAGNFFNPFAYLWAKDWAEFKRLAGVCGQETGTRDGVDAERLTEEIERLQEIIGMVGRGEIRTLYGWDSQASRMAYWARRTWRVGDIWHDGPMVGPFATALGAIMEAAKNGESEAHP